MRRSAKKEQCWEPTSPPESRPIRFPPNGDQQAYTRMRRGKITTVRPFRLGRLSGDQSTFPRGKERSLDEAGFDDG
jgi:hypothetical protein